jgi:hypothetical protein
MGILDGLVQMLQMVYSQVVNVPLDNPLSYLYVILNIFLLLFASFGGTT